MPESTNKRSDNSELQDKRDHTNAGAEEVAPPAEPVAEITVVNNAVAGGRSGAGNQANRANHAVPNGGQSSSLKLPVGDASSAEDGFRRSSIVSFQEVCEVYEIDMDKDARKKEVIRTKPSPLCSVRYYVMALALISPFITTYSKTIINFAITDMIDPEFVVAKNSSANSSTPLLSDPSISYFDLDHSCPVDNSVRARLDNENEQDIRKARAGLGDKFQWDTIKQGLLKAGYSIGHAPFQIPGSRMSEVYGSHRVMSASSLLIAICCIAAPYLARVSFYLIFADLVVLGILGSFMTPALITLFSNWLTPSEKSMMLSFYLIPSRLGYALSSVLCGILIEAELSWRYVFYSAGWISFAFSAAFFLCARSRPQDHPFTSQLELDYLATKNTLVREGLAQRKEAAVMADDKDNKERAGSYELKGFTNSASAKAASQTEPNETVTKTDASKEKKGRKAGETNGAPWLAIVSSVPVWAFILTKFSVKLAGDTIQTELPTYLKRVMHFSAKDNGKINAWNYVIFCSGCMGVGSLAKIIVKRRPFGMSKTAIRKLFQCFASFGVSLALLGIAFSVCDSIPTQTFLMLAFLVTTFSIGGESQIPLDISEHYPGTIHAIGSSLAISGIIEPPLVGFVIRGHAADRDSWKSVWLGASAVAFIGGIIFLLFAEATIQPFDRVNHGEDDVEAKGKTKKTDGTENKAFDREFEMIDEAPADETDAKSKPDGKDKGLYKESIQI